MSDEYIRKADAIDEVNHALDRETILFSFVRKVAISALKKLPSADVVHVCRCANCIHHAYDEIFSCYWCEHPGMVGEVKPDFYCAYGERREE